MAIFSIVVAYDIVDEKNLNVMTEDINLPLPLQSD